MSRGRPDSDQGSDWLADSDDDGRARSTSGSRSIAVAGSQSMAARDSAKVEQKMYDEGYREGITSGKESMIQPGFDQGYKKGAPAGRAFGRVRGTASAIESMLRSDKLPSGASQAVRARLVELQRRLTAIKMADLVEQDWEALEHAKEHGEDVGAAKRESAAERKEREAILPALQREADAIAADACGSMKG